MLFQSSIGIDVGADAFHIFALKAGFKGLQPAGHTRFAFDAGLAATDKIKVIADVTGDFIRQNGLGPADINVGISRSSVVLREIQLPLSVKENLRTTLQYQMQKYVPLPAEDVYFDYLVVEENSAEAMLRLLLIAVRKTHLDSYMALTTYLGRKLSGVEITATALAGFFAQYPPPAGADLLGIVFSGASDVEVMLQRRGVLLFSRHLPMPATSNGDFPPALDAAVRAAGEVLPEAKDAIRWINMTTESTATLQGCLGDGAAAVFIEPDLQSAELPGPEFATACGLAVKSLGGQGNSINLLPPQWRKKPSRFSYYALLALTLLTLLSMVAWAGSQVARYKMAQDRIDALADTIKDDAAAVQDLEKQAAHLEKQLADIATLQNQSVSALQVLKTLSDRIPASAWVENVTYSRDDLQIEGFADSAREILEILEVDPLFKDVVFRSAIRKDKNGKERFRIAMKLE